jgi:hypothetical protein
MRHSMFSPHILLSLTVIVLAAAVLAWKIDPILDWVLDQRYHRSLPKPTFPPPRDDAEARRQDLDYLAQLPTLDRSFTSATQSEFEQRIAALRARAADLSPAQFLMGIAEAVARANNGHTILKSSAWREKLNSSPVRLGWFSDGLYVIRATTPYVALLGRHVLAIDGLDPAALDHESTRYFGGTPEHAHAWNTILLESPQALHVMHPEAPDDRLSLRLSDAQGQEQTAELPPVLPKDALPSSVPARLLSPVPLRTEPPGAWHTVLDPEHNLPPSLREPWRSLYTTRLREGRVLYLHLWTISDEDVAPVGAAIRAAAGGSSDPPWQQIILDLRFDPGGDYTRVYRAIRALPEQVAPNGRLRILTDNTTFSAALVSAAWARYFGGKRANIVGETVGDRMTFWAEGLPVRLPNSGITIYIATGYHDWARGCRELRCYWPNYYYDVAVGDLNPDVPIGWRFDDYRRGMDTVLERALD